MEGDSILSAIDCIDDLISVAHTRHIAFDVGVSKILKDRGLGSR